MNTLQPLSDISSARILIAGIARNCEKTMRREILQVRAAFQGALELHTFVVESDSTDQTRAVLAALESELPDFRFRSLGNLDSTIPRRTDRIAYCRNAYLDELRTNPLYASVNLVVVADLDGVNNLLSAEAVRSCFTRTDWDVCTANQRAPYYDIWALRHPAWNPNDCLNQYAFLTQHGMPRELGAWVSIYGKMITIPESSGWIPVDSAFGGLGIYRRALLEGVRYVGIDEEDVNVCEHVPFHAQLRAKGARIFINPRLINTAYTENSRQRTFAQSVKRGVRFAARRLWPF